LSAGLGAWSAREYRDLGDPGMLALAVGSFAAMVGLVFYFGWALRRYQKYSYLSLAFLMWSLLPGTAQACSVCLGNPNSPLVQSANAGVLFLMGVIGAMLVAFAGLFTFWGIRSHRQSL